MSFENCWKEKHPHLKIRASFEYICSDFHIVAICYNYRTFRELTRDGYIYFIPYSANILNNIRVDSTAYEGEEDGYADDVALIRVTLEHVVAAKFQRELCCQKNSGGYIKCYSSDSPTESASAFIYVRLLL